MQNRNNREFKELIEKVYEQKFDSRNYIKKLLEGIKTIPTFLYDETSKVIKIELKEDELPNNYSDLDKFYNELQNNYLKLNSVIGYICKSFLLDYTFKSTFY